MFEILKPCPACGKKKGEVVENGTARFPYAVLCGACGWVTPYVKQRDLAVALWNKAKKP